MTRLLDTIGGRVIALLLLLASVAMTGPVTTYVAAQRHDAALAELERIAESRPLIERLRAGIYQVVMESRGLYLAADRKQAETFARGQENCLPLGQTGVSGGRQRVLAPGRSFIRILSSPAQQPALFERLQCAIDAGCVGACRGKQRQDR